MGLFWRIIRRLLRKYPSFAQRLTESAESYHIQFSLLLKRQAYPDDRFAYQSKTIDFDISEGASVIDIGSGDYPFPYATVLADRYLKPSEHRAGQIALDDRPMTVADISQMPFATKSFDFVYCSHILEHVEDPIECCQEIMRIGKRGYIETPTFGKDMLFSWAKDMHQWHVVSIAHTLCFFEYSPQQLEGLRSSAWQDIIFSRWAHPLQHAFHENQDNFNVMFLWQKAFDVYVFRLDGSVQTHLANA